MNLKKILIMFILIYIPCCSYGKSIVKAEWGKEKGQFLFYNSRSKDYNEPFAIGPLSIKLLKKNQIAVLDSIKGVINLYSAKGEYQSEHEIGKIRENSFINGFEFDDSSDDLYILGEDRIYRKRNGVLENWFGSRGHGKGQFLQPYDIKIFKDYIAVGDFIREQIFIISKSSREVIHTVDWARTGFAFDPKGFLLYLRYSKGDGYSLWKINPATKDTRPVFMTFLGFDEDMFGMLCGISNGKLLLKFPDNKGNVRVDAVLYDGRRVFSKNFKNCVPEGHQFCFANDSIYSLEYDADQAPKGNGVSINVFSIPKKSRFPVDVDKNSSVRTVDLGKNVSVLRYFQNVLYALSEGVIYSINGSTMTEVFSLKQFKGHILDFYILRDDFYVLTDLEEGKIFRLDRKGIVKMSFPEPVEEDPIYKFPVMMFMSDENNMACVTDYYLGRSVCIDLEKGNVQSMIYDYSNGLLTPQLFFMTCSFNSKNYTIKILDSHGNIFDTKGPFELENKIALAKIFPCVKENGEFMVYVEDERGNGIVETYDFQANMLNRVSVKLPVSVIQSKKVEFDSKTLFFIKENSKLVAIDLK